MSKFKWLFLALLSVSSLAAEFDDVVIKTQKAAENVYMLTGAGGNIGVFVDDSGLVMIDDQFAPLSAKIEHAMQAISGKKIKYIINTHYHGDHTGGNSNFAKYAPIIAHHNVYERLADKEPAEQVALPEITYQEQMKIHFAKQTVKLIHLEKGHTDGDTAVYFEKSKVLHTGDLFFELGFPYIDLKGGGSVKGYLKNVEYLIANTPDDVVIIPGHGKLTNKKRYQAFADMIKNSIAFVEQALQKGKTEQQILAAGLPENLKIWSWRFINEEKWLKTLIADLT